ncbi:MAG TPA: Uma2 family endonuclease [Thermoanaerobaculia bacterium]|nr:Uma2 family endonuclease [Thermoanaerobaculia bacterium]
MAFPIVRKRFNVDEYHAMARAGILHEDDRVELIEGEILEMTPIGSRHAGCVTRLNRLLLSRLGDTAVVSVQNPILLNDDSEPQPDLMILRRREDFYSTAHPGPADVLLLIEVADSSLEADREFKAPLYGRHGIHETWVVDLERSLVESHFDPDPEGYRRVQIFRRGESISPQAFPDLSLTISEIFG